VFFFTKLMLLQRKNSVKKGKVLKVRYKDNNLIDPSNLIYFLSVVEICRGVAQLVACHVRDVEVAGSSPVAPTRNTLRYFVQITSSR
jgi:hypothetical protein